MIKTNNSGSISSYANIMLNKVENRADTTQFNDVLLSAFLNNPTITREIALNIPSLNAGIGFIADMISITPLKLYTEKNNNVEEVINDVRVSLFNDDPKDTLDRVQFMRAIVFDYFLGKGGYAYLNKKYASLESVHYVDQRHISYMCNSDPIFKEYDILVNGERYKPFDFLKVLRNTRDGYKGISLLEESPYLLSVVYNQLLLENALAKKGGVRDCFLQSAEELTQETMDAIQNAWEARFSSIDRSTAIILNSGITKADAGMSSVEMQMNENKTTNSHEICKLLRISEKVLSGDATEQDFMNSITTGVLPVMYAIQNAMNRDVLLEKEKSNMYWAFDTTEITKGNIKSRYDAYKVGLDAGFLQVDEVRYKEDLDPLNFNFIKLNLADIFYNPETKEIYTPNTNQVVKLDEITKPINNTHNEIKGGE